MTKKSIQKFHRKWVLLLIISMFLMGESLLAQQWETIVGKENLTALFSNTEITWNGIKGEYCADGNGVIFANGTTFTRTWSIEDNETACISSDFGKECYRIEQNKNNSFEFRVLTLETGERTIVKILPGGCGSDEVSSSLSKDWLPIVNENDIRTLFENKVYEWENGYVEFCENGTGTVYEFDSEFARSWEVKGDNYCITTQFSTTCYTIERNIRNPEVLRERNLINGEYSIVKSSTRVLTSCAQ